MAGEFQLAKWFVEIGEKGTSKVLRQLDTVKSKLAAIPKKMTLELGSGLKGALGAAGITFSLLKIAEAGAKAEASMVRFDTMFKNTAKGGFSAGFNLEEMKLLTDFFGKSTGFGKGNARDAAREFLDVGRISGDQFIKAMEVAGDMAHMNGTTMVEAARQIGLAVADPSKAQRIMRQAGELLTPDEQKLLAASKKGGKAFSDAQSLVLEKLAADVKGAAEAMRNNSLTGAWMQFQQELKRIGQLFGKDIIGGMTQAVRFLTFVVANLKDVFSMLGDYIQRPFTYLGEVIQWAIAKLEAMPLFGGGPKPGAFPEFFAGDLDKKVDELGKKFNAMFGPNWEFGANIDNLRGRPGFVPDFNGAKPVKLQILNLDESWSKLQDALDGGQDDQARAADGIEDMLAELRGGVRIKNPTQVAWA